MTWTIETSTPPGTMTPVGPYSHISKAGPLITISATAGVDPATGELAGPDVASQTRQILDGFEIMLESVGAGMDNIMHVTVFLTDMADFAEMNAAYAEKMGELRPARSAVSVTGVPKPGALLTMNLIAVVGDEAR
jgi:2-iminobutanoate/2-iminopropanoate deaminase